jgi:DNA-binding beta-propeller fold protein YncE
MRTLSLVLFFLIGRLAEAGGGPAVIELPSSLVYPDFWHTPLGIHRGTAKLLSLFSGGKANFDDPEGMACTRMKENGPENPQLTVFGVNSGQSCVIYNPDMMSLDILGRQGSGDNEFDHPLGVAALADGNVAVADTGNHRVVLLEYKDKKLRWKGTLGRQGKGPGEFEKPGWVALDSKGQLYVSDTGNNRVQVFSDQGQYLFSFGEHPDSTNSLIEPQAIAVVDPTEANAAEAEGAIYVVDQYHGRLQKFDLAGRFLASASAQDAGGRFLVYFSGIALDYYGNLWVTDRGNHQIHKFDKFLQNLDSWGEKGQGDYHLDSPRGIAIYRHYGQVFIAEKNSAQYLWIGADVKDVQISKALNDQGRNVMRVDYRLTESATLQCWIETEKEPHTNLATLLSQKKISQGPRTLSWDGVTTGGELIAPGAYQLVFQAEASYSSATYFKKETRKKFWVK